MRSFSLIAPAKINLHLEIIGDRPDGYHELVMIMQSVSLSDRLELHSQSKDGITLHCQHPQVPLDETNLAYQAASLMQKEFPDVYANYGGVAIKIEKNIPVAAGLAGGSANAAAVLVGINQMWKLGLTQPELQSLGAKLGSDVPFCLAGGTAIATGRGEAIDSILDLEDLWVVLAKHNNLSVSTAWAYSAYREKFHHEYVTDLNSIAERATHIHSGPLVSAIGHRDKQEIGKLIHNDLERVVLPEFPQVEQLRSAFQETSVLGTMMTGSGPTVFALCSSKSQAQQAIDRVRSQLNNPDLNFWLTNLCNTGIQIAATH